jgi:hypothetical protein
MREMGDQAGEADTLALMSVVLYQHLSRQQDAMNALQQAMAVLDATDLLRTSSGNTREELQQTLDTMRQGLPLKQADQPAIMPAEELDRIIYTTVVVMTTMLEQQAEWYSMITDDLRSLQREDGWQNEIDFFTALLALLDGQSPSLPGNHPYAAALSQIRAGIAAGGMPDL